MSFDPAEEADRICQAMRVALARDFARRGYVVAISGGVDSAVCAALAARAVGPERVLGLHMPERDSDPASVVLAEQCATQLGISRRTIDISGVLDSLGCYDCRDEAIRRLVPDYGPGWRCKLSLPPVLDSGNRINVTMLVVEDPQGHRRRVRPGPSEYRQIVAATNYKQRVRTMMSYHWADMLHFAVVGTPNRVEYDQGFFVKGGDGLADIKPIAHLYKGEVYALAHVLGVSDDVVTRPSTTDTFSLPQSQEEFYFAHAAPVLDLLLKGLNAGSDVAAVARETGLGEDEVRRAWDDLVQKRRSTRYLHSGAVLVAPVDLTHAAMQMEH